MIGINLWYVALILGFAGRYAMQSVEIKEEK